jgi:peptidoglycan/LPS O-acetylase OafA/YrhL
MAAAATGVALTMAVTLALAYASWWLVERPTLSLKHHPVYLHKAADAAKPAVATR